MIKSKFLRLSNRKRWEIAKKLKGVRWYCEHCGTLVDDGVMPKQMFMGERCCGNCDGTLTHRTGGGQNDPFFYFPRKIYTKHNNRI